MIITPEIKERVEKTALALDIEHGIIYLTFHIRAGQVSRHTIGHEVSFRHNGETPIHNDIVQMKKKYRIKNRIPVDK